MIDFKKKSIYIKLFMLCLFYYGYYLYDNKTVERDELKYYEFYNSPLEGIVTYSTQVRNYSKIRINNRDKYYYFIPKYCNSNRIAHELRPEKGDIISKKPECDSLLIKRNNSIRIICTLPPWEQ